MSFKVPLIFAFTLGFSAALADDDFDLPDDVQKTEVPANAEDISDGPVNFAPIEATTTETTSEAPAKPLPVKNKSAKDIAKSYLPPVPEEKPVQGGKHPLKQVQGDVSVQNPNEEDKPAAFKAHQIPDDLDRPLRVGIFTGVKELYLKYQGETVHVTPHGKMVRFEADGNSTEDIAHEFNSEDGGCLAVAADKKSLGRACYPGSVMFRTTNGKLDAINSVDVEDYLRGVIPYEIGKLDSSRIEALKAQAVAARTYAYKHFNSRESMGFDVFADTKDQVYKGLESATPLTDAAVKATTGVVMTYGGEFIIAYYHSTCGGVTETLATWNRPDVPYLHSKPDLRPNGKPWCDESSYIKWERRFADKEIVKLLKANAVEAKATFSVATGKDFKKVKSIKIKDKLNSGRIMTLRVETDKGHFDVLTDRTRWLFKKAGTILPSSFFTIKKEGKEWVLTGTGFGHGVGMCQMGVRARAQAGQSYQEILSHYYQGITLEKFER
ncbi:stage II sporulation protein D [Fibrobacter sp. UWB15]|uniref:SpoIID/LytB domain-containing protein n=1 Tax=unclassified Fibrobacter TaxID=2634177 RepID=UPI00091B4BB7|nr:MULTISPECIES: SpoIID/LytB domain-containing protein [unclassified Fibrobacter]PWJ67364.1 stage II sporulation protein D [Fibrobacter sp. UWB6]SHF65537.1 stage II sporulation protein D [Fibrobacter sp. UWB8]SMG09874.1 stage II sporulation protein D [Fibrobacter sp. UWB15]